MLRVCPANVWKHFSVPDWCNDSVPNKNALRNDDYHWALDVETWQDHESIESDVVLVSDIQSISRRN